MNVRTLCLAILNFQDATGYEIKKLSTEGAFSHFVDVSYGSIYPTLSKLEDEEIVSCRMETQQGKPDRKIYTITDKGREEFVRLINVRPLPDKIKSEFLLLCMNASLAEPALVNAAVDEYVAHWDQELKMLEQKTCDTSDAAAKWTAELGLVVMRAKLDYINKNRDALLAVAGQRLVKQAAE